MDTTLWREDLNEANESNGRQSAGAFGLGTCFVNAMLLCPYLEGGVEHVTRRRDGRHGGDDADR